MRTLLAVMLLAATAEAAPIVTHPLVPALAPIDPATLPRACVALAKPANVRHVAVALAARISLAQCLAGAQIAAQTGLIDTQDSIDQLEASVAPSLALLDEAIGCDDPAVSLEGLHARGVLYVALTTRMLAALPALLPSASTDAVELHDQRAAVLATWLEPWRDKAHAAFASAVAVGLQFQGPIAQDRTASAALADSKVRLDREAVSSVASR